MNFRALSAFFLGLMTIVSLEAAEKSYVWGGGQLTLQQRMITQASAKYLPNQQLGTVTIQGEVPGKSQWFEVHLVATSPKGDRHTTKVGCATETTLGECTYKKDSADSRTLNLKDLQAGVSALSYSFRDQGGIDSLNIQFCVAELSNNEQNRISSTRLCGKGTPLLEWIAQLEKENTLVESITLKEIWSVPLRTTLGQ